MSVIWKLVQGHTLYVTDLTSQPITLTECHATRKGDRRYNRVFYTPQQKRLCPKQLKYSLETVAYPGVSYPSNGAKCNCASAEYTAPVTTSITHYTVTCSPIAK